MAGMAKAVSNSSESVLDLSFSTDTTSLQELIESELAMRDTTNTSQTNPIQNGSANPTLLVSVPNNRKTGHNDSSPSSRFDEIYRETFDDDVEETFTNTPEILSPQLTSSTEFLDMSYSMKFDKLTESDTYDSKNKPHNQLIIDPILSTKQLNNREDTEIDSLEHCQEITRLKQSLKNDVISNEKTNGDLAHMNGNGSDYEEINFEHEDHVVKMKNLYNEKYHNEQVDDSAEYEEISKFNLNQTTNLFIENEIYHINRDKIIVENGVNGIKENPSMIGKQSLTKKAHDIKQINSKDKISAKREIGNSYENVQVNGDCHVVASVEDSNDPFGSIPPNQLVDTIHATSAINYNVTVPEKSAEDHVYENGSNTTEEALYENIPSPEQNDQPEEEVRCVEFDEFDPTEPVVTSTNHVVKSFSTFSTVEVVESKSEATELVTEAVRTFSNPQIIGVSSKSQFVEPIDQLVFESWTTPDVVQKEAEENESQAASIEESSISQENLKQEVLTESFETSEKKTAKKKKNGVTEEITTTTTKVKKSKKSKKSDEKENHISVVQSTTKMEEDDLSNVCVRDLRAYSLSDLTRDATGPVFLKPKKPISKEPLKIFTGVSVQALKSSFSKFDELSKKALASSMTDVPRTLQNGGSTSDVSSPAPGTAPPALCKSCGKTVFVMEQIKAEKQTWHKNCFRCHECNKQLTLDIYSSHEGVLYCKPHFRELFKPKAVVENEDAEPVRRRKPELIIRENQPMELPPDVVRASDKPDLGLEELSSLNVKSRYQVFENSVSSEDKSPSGPVNVKRSPSILSKLAKFQAKGMSAGVSDENLNGAHYEESETSSEGEGENVDESKEKIIKNRKKRERPLSFSKMEDVKKTWENGPMTKEERLEERKLEKQNIRSRLFMGKQGKMKEMYEQAVADSEKGIKKEIDIELSQKAKNMKEKFEKGEVNEVDGDESKNKSAIEEDLGVFEAGISKKSRSLFLELDANAAKTVTTTPPPHSSPRSPRFEESRRLSNSREGDSPEREVYRDPNVVRSDDPLDDEIAVIKNATASKMLSIFRQMEEDATKENIPDGPKPLKSFTPPPDYKGHTGDTESEPESEEEEEEEEEEESEADDIVRASDKVEDEFLKQAANAARAKALAAKFERWEPEKQSSNNAISMLESEQASIDITKSLRARFESLNNPEPAEKPRPKVNRFVVQPDALTAGTLCNLCNKKVYPLEKIETDGKLFHRACFRCTQCCTILRMESYTMNNGHLYCLPHFKQLFITKGNYDEGFGTDQHKRKWQSVATAN